MVGRFPRRGARGCMRRRSAGEGAADLALALSRRCALHTQPAAPFPTPPPLPPPPCHPRTGQGATWGGRAALSVWDFGTAPQSKPDQDLIHFGSKSGTSFGTVSRHHKRSRLGTCSGRHLTGRNHNGTKKRTWSWCRKMDLFLGAESGPGVTEFVAGVDPPCRQPPPPLLSPSPQRQKRRGSDSIIV